MQKRCGVKFALYGHYIVTLDALESWNYFAIYLELNIAWRWVWWDIMKINYQINDVARRDPDQKYSNNAFFYTSNIKIDAVPNFHMHAFSLLKVKSKNRFFLSLREDVEKVLKPILKHFHWWNRICGEAVLFCNLIFCNCNKKINTINFAIVFTFYPIV